MDCNGDCDGGCWNATCYEIEDSQASDLWAERQVARHFEDSRWMDPA